MQEMCQCGVIKEVKSGDLEPMFVISIKLVGKIHGRAVQSGAKYHICVDFSKINGRMCCPAHSVCKITHVQLY